MPQTFIKSPALMALKLLQAGLSNSYSVIILPSQHCLEYCWLQKGKLVDYLGRRFASSASQAHISLASFSCLQEHLHLVIAYLQAFADATMPVQIHMNGFSFYPNGTFFLAPSVQSKELLKPIISTFAAGFPIRTSNLYRDPHMSIARSLTTHELEAAKLFFAAEQPDIYFLADTICLRQYNSERKQFDIINTFKLRGTNPPASTSFLQGKLF